MHPWRKGRIGHVAPQFHPLLGEARKVDVHHARAALGDPDNVSQDLRTANEEFRVPCGCLDFRHTFGSQLAMKGESLYKIATLLGNSPEICRRHYAALSPETMTGAVEFRRATQQLAFE
jgi:integrase